jgi:hypothetical protein
MTSRRTSGEKDTHASMPPPRDAGVTPVHLMRADEPAVEKLERALVGTADAFEKFLLDEVPERPVLDADVSVADGVAWNGFNRMPRVIFEESRRDPGFLSVLRLIILRNPSPHWRKRMQELELQVGALSDPPAEHREQVAGAAL